MKAAWLHKRFESDFSSGGGAELTIRNRIKAGEKRGHTIDKIPPDKIALLATDYDLYILSDTKYSFPSEIIRDRYPAVRIFHNYHFCRYSTFLCQSFFSSSNLPLRQKLELGMCLIKKQCFGFMENVKLFFFMSPLQKQVTERFFGREFTNGVVVPSSIDTSLFYDKNERRSGACAVSTGRWNKGIENVKKWCKDNDEQLTLIRGVPYNKMNDVYNKHEYFVHLPNGIEPCGRTVFEAALAGCKVVVNNRVGAASFDWWGTDKIREHLEKASDKFWKILEDEFE
ncbi:MAG: glycosyltransferase [Methanophagales archaeon]|nr:glycosyltransferase [Methanophagales archaeon]